MSTVILGHCIEDSLVHRVGFEPTLHAARHGQGFSALASTFVDLFFVPLSATDAGATEGIRTPDPRLRRPLLYPTELQSHY